MKFHLLIPILFLFSCSKKVETEVNYNLHTFYYNWYGNPEFDGEYRHWAHQILPHWSDSTWNNLPPHKGEDDIGANFFPQLGCYSNNDTSIIRKHMQMIKSAGIGTICMSWWGKNSYEDKSLILYLNAAEKQNLKINIHLEPFPNRTAQKTIDAVKYIINTYGSHPAFYKKDDKPMFYIYDSYLINKDDWRQALTSVRNTKYDGIFIGLWVEEGEENFFLESGFDGFYTYFVSEGFTYGSSIKNWKHLSNWAEENNKLFIPCIGPGYSDTQVRPWNGQNFKNRENGKYYDMFFKAALDSKAELIGITSFNEWHEGTQIEPSIKFKNDSFKYEDFGNLPPDFYLKETKKWSLKFF